MVGCPRFVYAFGGKFAKFGKYVPKKLSKQTSNSGHVHKKLHFLRKLTENCRYIKTKLQKELEQPKLVTIDLNQQKYNLAKSDTIYITIRLPVYLPSFGNNQVKRMNQTNLPRQHKTQCSKCKNSTFYQTSIS